MVLMYISAPKIKKQKLRFKSTVSTIQTSIWYTLIRNNIMIYQAIFVIIGILMVNKILNNKIDISYQQNLFLVEYLYFIISSTI